MNKRRRKKAITKALADRALSDKEWLMIAGGSLVDARRLFKYTPDGLAGIVELAKECKTFGLFARGCHGGYRK